MGFGPRVSAGLRAGVKMCGACKIHAGSKMKLTSCVGGARKSVEATELFPKHIFGRLLRRCAPPLILAPPIPRLCFCARAPCCVLAPRCVLLPLCRSALPCLRPSLSAHLDQHRPCCGACGGAAPASQRGRGHRLSPQSRNTDRRSRTAHRPGTRLAVGSTDRLTD